MYFGLSYILALIWIAYLIIAGVTLFSRGFLLSRVSKTAVNNCAHLAGNHSKEPHLTEELARQLLGDVSKSHKICLPQKSRIVILLIDALKYDFGVFNSNRSTTEQQQPLPFENRLLVMHELLQQKPAQTRLMRFKADPPTTTLQRLKGLTTGSLPTFIDIGSNFATPEINEDNLIDQLLRYKMPMVFMGDATWTDLYPKRFLRSYAYPSFDIYDLDTVDKNLRIHLPKELERNDWQLLVAHFLGVDHCGHRYGPLHSEMTRKLDEMNEVIREVIDKLDEHTTLIVMGDHGMTMSGDHGGDTEAETNALLFAFTPLKQGFLPNAYGSSNETMQQIDLVPTLATILGLAIPYSNLGLINFNLIPDVEVPYLNRYQAMLLHIWQNVQQVTTYFREYALENSRSFSMDQLDDLEIRYLQLTQRVKTVYTEAAFKSLMIDMNAYLRSILNICREIWVKFDATQMSHGLLATILPIFFCFILINNSHPTNLHQLFNLRDIGYIYLFNFAAAIFGYRYYKNLSFKSEAHAIIFSTNIISSLIFIYHIVRHWANISLNWSKMSKFKNIPARILLIILVSVYYSNSFIIQEGKVLAYLLIASIVLLIYDLWKSTMRQFVVNQRLHWRPLFRITSVKLCMISFILSLIFVRCAMLLFLCREEQGDCYYDQNTNYNNSASTNLHKEKSYWTDGMDIPNANVLSVISLGIYVTITRLYLRYCGNLTGQSMNVLLARYGSTICAVCAGAHMLLTSTPTQIPVQRSHIDLLAIIVYAILLLQILVLCINPLMVFVLRTKASNNGKTILMSPEHYYSSTVPDIFNHLKRVYEEEKKDSRSNVQKPVIPTVYGLATVYSSTIISFGVFLSLFLILITDVRASVGLLLCLSLAVVLLIIHAVINYNDSTNFESCVQPRFNIIVAWFLLAQFCFFATSHQTTLSQIEWKAAFVGRTVGLGQSKLISGLLVLLNTFSGQVLFFGLYSLLSMNTFSLVALFPKLTLINVLKNRRRIEAPEKSFDVNNGELLLYDKEKCFMGGLFKLACQFYMLQGLKVFSSMLACTIHCRHLMVWKIFAPRFIYEALATCISLPALIIGFLLVLRIHRALNSLIIQMNKLK